MKRTATKIILTAAFVTMLFFGCSFLSNTVAKTVRFDRNNLVVEKKAQEAHTSKQVNKQRKVAVVKNEEDLKMEQQFMDAKSTAYNDNAHIRTREQYLEVISNCVWEPNHGIDNLKVDLFHVDHTLHSTRQVQATWCTVKLSENSWLGTVRLNYGKLLPGIHYILKNKKPGLSMFWNKVSETSNRNLKSFLTAGFGWPMLRDGENAELQPAAYPPIHTHHGVFSFRKDGASKVHIASHADSYCSERDDHCLWESFEEDYGFQWEYNGDLEFNYYIETMAATQCPLEPFPSESDVIMEIGFELTMAPEMKNIVEPSLDTVLAMPAGNPMDLDHETDINPFAPHLMQAPVGRSIMSWQNVKFPAGRLVKQDIDGHVKMHSHSAHTSAALLFRATPMDLGLDEGQFVRKVNVFEHSVPLLLGDTSTDGNGFSVEEAKAYVLAHVTNGADAAESIPEMKVDSSTVRQFGGGQRSLSSNDRNRLMCVWAGPSVGYGNCDESSMYSDGFDRRAHMFSPPGGNCAAEWKGGETLTWVYFNTPSERGAPFLHSTFYPWIVYDKKGDSRVEFED